MSRSCNARRSRIGPSDCGGAALGAFAVVLLCGFSCEPRPPGPVSLDRIEWAIRAGRAPEAVAECCRALGEIGSRSDFEADRASGWIYRALFELRPQEIVAAHPETRLRCVALEPYLSDPLGRPFLALGIAADLRVLTGASPPAARAVSSSRLAATLLREAEDAKLRSSQLPDHPGLHRLLLLEAAAAFEHTALRNAPGPRKRLVELLEKIAADYRTLGGMKAQQFAQNLWKDLEEEYAELAIRVAKDEELPPLPEDLAGWSNFTVDRHLEEGDRRFRKGMTSGSDVKESERGYRAALRHFLFARETLAERTSSQERALSTTQGAAKCWKTVCFDD